MSEIALQSPPVANALTSAMIAGDGWKRPLPGLTTRSASPSISELVDVLGTEATHKLCETLGGITLDPSAPIGNLVEFAIGKEAADKLSAYWGSGRLYIPRRALSIKARHQMVRDLAKDGLSRAAIAMRVQLSERQVYNILGRAAAAVLLALPAARFVKVLAETGTFA